MLALNNENDTLLYNKFQENIANKYVSIFGNSQQLRHCYIYGIYTLNEMSASPILFGVMLYPRNTGKKFAEIYVRMYVPLLQLIYICWESNNI